MFSNEYPRYNDEIHADRCHFVKHLVATWWILTAELWPKSPDSNIWNNFFSDLLALRFEKNSKSVGSGFLVWQRRLWTTQHEPLCYVLYFYRQHIYENAGNEQRAVCRGCQLASMSHHLSPLLLLLRTAGFWGWNWVPG